MPAALLYEVTVNFTAMRRVGWMILTCSSGLLLGCPKTITVDGQTVVEDKYHQSVEQVKRAGALEFSCPPEKLTTKVLTRSVHATVDRFQVTGCEQEGIFTRSGEETYAPETSPPVPE